MSIGAGITMIVFGLIFLLGVIQLDVPGINEQALGIILTLGGIAIIVFQRGLFGAGVRRTGTTDVVTERRVVEQPPVTEQPRVVERRVVEREVDDPNLP
jgi:hypothetical protein